MFSSHRNVSKLIQYAKLRPYFSIYKIKPLNNSNYATIYTICNKNENKTLLDNSSSNDTNNILKQNSIRTVLRVGPGYTHFGHGRQKLKLSKYAYFYYAFLASGIMFACFFDFEDYLLRGRTQEERQKDIQMLFDRTNSPKAKELSKVSKEELEEASNNSVSDQKDDDSKEKDDKKSKTSFRNRKVSIFSKIDFEFSLNESLKPNR